MNKQFDQQAKVERKNFIKLMAGKNVFPLLSLGFTLNTEGYSVIELFENKTFLEDNPIINKHLQELLVEYQSKKGHRTIYEI